MCLETDQSLSFPTKKITASASEVRALPLPIAPQPLAARVQV